MVAEHKALVRSFIMRIADGKIAEFWGFPDVRA